MRWACLVATVVACVTAAGSSAAIDRAKPAAPASRFGIADGGDLQALRGPERGRYLDAVKGVGADWIRIGIYWSVIQRRGPTAYDWAPFDRVVKAARRRGLRVLGTIVYAPAWARARRPASVAEGQGDPGAHNPDGSRSSGRGSDRAPGETAPEP